MANIILDDETTAALTLFNEYVAADRERTAREKRIRKAEQAKIAAAAVVKKLAKDVSSAKRQEAEAAYRSAVEKWQALRDGKQLSQSPDDSETAKSDDAKD